ncbi:hypothetical protein K458DRAFT_488595 [Lentithecium fluviatile CBS 122367]|uniref:Uncharacterized protein n=1 Tax=Lentithecium fluviatile CBS 122367 TaxID=1168545 RepID=A0A6G1IY58_9PLEO|nr:hypothetical protein K458DRAFT_488595 [Lentithecium fluviatile CBS 122367]
MVFPGLRWLATLTYIIHLLLLVRASNHAHPYPVAHTSSLTFRRDALNFTNNSTTFTNTTMPECKLSLHDFTATTPETSQRYRNVSSCAIYTVPTYGLPPFESDDRLGLMAVYLNPFSDRILGKRASQEPQACNYPDIVPIFERTIAPFHNDTDGKWLAVEKTPSQYLRCLLQAPEGMVESCVSSSIRKLQWLPNRLIVYGGQKKCNTQFHMMFTTIQKMVLEVLHFMFEVWRARRKRKTDPDDYRSFSWVGLFRAVIVGIGTPLICALIIRTQFPENSIAAALGLYLLLPTAAPIIAFLSGIFLSKGFGTQTLLVDLVSAGAALVMYNLPLKVWIGSNTNFSSTAERPNTGFLYLGLYLATVPAGVVFFIYQALVILAVSLLIWAMFAKSKGLAKTAGWLIGLWIALWIWIISFAVFAIAEVAWLATSGSRKKKKKKSEDAEVVKKFPGLVSLRKFFHEDRFGRFLSRWGYWSWVIVSFITAAGRWMFLLQLLQLTGPAFCPDSLTGATVTSFFVPFAAIGANILLKIYGLAL